MPAPPALLDNKKRKNGVKTMVGYHGITQAQAAIIDEMLFAGDSPNKIANFIQKEWKVATTVTSVAVLQRIISYRNNVFGENMLLATAKKNRLEKDSLGVLSREIDTVEELVSLIETQKARLSLALKLEHKKDNINTQTTQNIKLLGELLLKMAELQMELGLLQRVPKKVNVAGDVTKEEQEFIEKAVLSGTNTEVVKDAVLYLKEHGILALPEAETTQ